MTKKKRRETRLWQIDPSLYEPGRKAGIFERYVFDGVRSFAKYTFFVLAFAYPILLVTLGIAFGGVVFWASLAGSIGVIYLVIRQAGYSANFESWDVGYKKFLGLIAAFGIYVAFVYGLEYIKLWTIPVFAAILVAVLVLGIWRISKR